MRGLAAVPLNGIFQRQGPEIVHVPRVHAESPERHGAQFVRCILRRVLDDAVAGMYVMKQEIAVRMNNFVAQF